MVTGMQLQGYWKYKTDTSIAGRLIDKNIDMVCMAVYMSVASMLVFVLVELRYLCWMQVSRPE